MEVGVIGCGEITMVHIPFVLSDSKSGILGVDDGDRSRAHSIAREFGIPKSYEGFTALMAERKPGVIHVVTPPQANASIAIQPLEQVFLPHSSRLVAIPEREGSSHSTGVSEIGTTFASSGLYLDHEKHILLADTPDEFVRSIEIVLSNRGVRDNLSKAGVELVNGVFFWDLIGQSLIEAYDAAKRANDKGIYNKN